jgi:hypothetical protein
MNLNEIIKETTLLNKSYREDYYPYHREAKNIYFKDLEFRVIDLTDTSNIQLEPMSTEDFWSNEFQSKIE